MHTSLSLSLFKYFSYFSVHIMHKKKLKNVLIKKFAEEIASQPPVSSPKNCFSFVSPVLML